MGSEPEIRVQGSIVSEGHSDEVPISRLRVRLIDVSHADGPAKLISEQETANARLVPGVSLPFSLTVPTCLDERTRLEIAVHADKDNSGAVSTGDFVTMVSVPVSTSHSSADVVVPIRQVT